MNINLNEPDDIIAWLCDGGDPVQATIGIAKLGALIGKALQMDGLTIDDHALVEMLTSPLEEREKMLVGGEASVDAGKVFLHGGDWMVSIAEHFGFTGETEGALDTAWMEGQPHIKAVWQAITRLSVQVMGAASDAYEQHHGHSMMEVFLLSAETGEDFDHSKVRLTAQRQGLRQVAKT